MIGEVWTTEDYARLVYMAGAMLGMILLVVRGVRSWSRYTSKMKDFWWSMFMWNMACFSGGFEVVLDLESSYRVYAVILAVAVSLKALLTPGPLNEGTTDGQSADQA